MVETLSVSIPLDELPEDVRRRLSQEALRRGVPVAVVIKEWLQKQSRRMTKTAA